MLVTDLVQALNKLLRTQEDHMPLFRHLLSLSIPPVPERPSPAAGPSAEDIAALTRRAQARIVGSAPVGQNPGPYGPLLAARNLEQRRPSSEVNGSTERRVVSSIRVLYLVVCDIDFICC
jgi:hypothetical protein